MFNNQITTAYSRTDIRCLLCSRYQIQEKLQYTKQASFRIGNSLESFNKKAQGVGEGLILDDPIMARLGEESLKGSIQTFIELLCHESPDAPGGRMRATQTRHALAGIEPTKACKLETRKTY